MHKVAPLPLEAAAQEAADAAEAAAAGASAQGSTAQRSRRSSGLVDRSEHSQRNRRLSNLTLVAQDEERARAKLSRRGSSSAVIRGRRDSLVKRKRDSMVKARRRGVERKLVEAAEAEAARAAGKDTRALYSNMMKHWLRQQQQRLSDRLLALALLGVLLMVAQLELAWHTASDGGLRRAAFGMDVPICGAAANLSSGSWEAAPRTAAGVGAARLRAAPAALAAVAAPSWTAAAPPATGTSVWVLHGGGAGAGAGGGAFAAAWYYPATVRAAAAAAAAAAATLELSLQPAGEAEGATVPSLPTTALLSAASPRAVLPRGAAGGAPLAPGTAVQALYTAGSRWYYGASVQRAAPAPSPAGAAAGEQHFAYSLAFPLERAPGGSYAPCDAGEVPFRPAWWWEEGGGSGGRGSSWEAGWWAVQLLRMLCLLSTAALLYTLLQYYRVELDVETHQLVYLLRPRAELPVAWGGRAVGGSGDAPPQSGSAAALQRALDDESAQDAIRARAARAMANDAVASDRARLLNIRLWQHPTLPRRLALEVLVLSVHPFPGVDALGAALAGGTPSPTLLLLACWGMWARIYLVGRVFFFHSFLNRTNARFIARFNSVDFNQLLAKVRCRRPPPPPPLPPAASARRSPPIPPAPLLLLLLLLLPPPLPSPPRSLPPSMRAPSPPWAPWCYCPPWATRCT